MAVQEGQNDSTLSLYRRALRLRRELDLGHGPVSWLRGRDEMLVFRRGPVLVVANLSPEPQPLPAGTTVLLASGPLSTNLLPVDTAAWLEINRTGRDSPVAGRRTR